MVWSAWLLIAVPIVLFLSFVLLGGDETETLLGLWILFGSIPTVILVAFLFITGSSLRRPEPATTPSDPTVATPDNPKRNLAIVLGAFGAVLLAFSFLESLRFARIADGTAFDVGSTQKVMSFLFNPLTLGGGLLLAFGFRLSRR